MNPLDLLVSESAHPPLPALLASPMNSGNANVSLFVLFTYCLRL